MIAGTYQTGNRSSHDEITSKDAVIRTSNAMNVTDAPVGSNHRKPDKSVKQNKQMIGEFEDLSGFRGLYPQVEPGGTRTPSVALGDHAGLLTLTKALQVSLNQWLSSRMKIPKLIRSCILEIIFKYPMLLEGLLWQWPSYISEFHSYFESCRVRSRSI